MIWLYDIVWRKSWMVKPVGMSGCMKMLLTGNSKGAWLRDNEFFLTKSGRLVIPSLRSGSVSPSTEILRCAQDDKADVGLKVHNRPLRKRD
jgi:hypothetical protein